MAYIALLVIFVLFHQCIAIEQSFAKDITQKVFGTESGLNGIVAAYGDINNDKITDVFVITGADRQNVSVLLGGKQNEISLISAHASVHFLSKVDSVAPGDFNGDGYMDILLTSSYGLGEASSQSADVNASPAQIKPLSIPVAEETLKSNTRDVQLSIVWGVGDGKFSSNIFTSTSGLLNQPLLLDANADMVIDLFVTRSNETSGEFWLGQKFETVSTNWNFQKCNQKKFAKNIGKNHSHAFIDYTGDGLANLVVKTNSGFEVWQGDKDGPMKIESFSFPPLNNGVIGQSAFGDINGDGFIDLLLPVCENEKGRCKNSKILLRLHGKNDWITLYEKNDWNFVQDPNGDYFITLVLGDYNSDVFVDILCVMQKGGSNSRSAVVLFGDKCNDLACNQVGRLFRFGFEVPNTVGAIAASFYDIDNNGKLDILVSTSANNTRKTRAFYNTISGDVNFLNVKILPNLETDRTTNLPGPCVSYTTTNTEGGNQQAASCQLPQSAYLSLQLPFISFGLGRLPNYVDSLSVSIPSPLIKTCVNISVEAGFTSSSRKWTMIIPNSQLFIKTYPSSDPDRWKLRMLVTPSKNIITTAAVLLGSCALMAISVVVFHCLERRDDLQEKFKDSQRFHFDAM